jgi:hypothetical protein
MDEFLFEGTADGRRVKIRVYAQNAGAAYFAAKEQLGCQSLTTLRTTKL